MRNCIRRLAINFSNILLMVGNIEIGLYLLRSSRESVLCTGITYAVFNLFGNIPVVREWLKMFAKMGERNSLPIFMIFPGISYMSVALVVFNSFILF